MVEAAAPAHDAAPRSRRKKPIHTQLWFWVLVGIVVGITLGLVAPGFAKQLKILADLFIQLIKVVIGPVIFCTVIVGIASLGNLARAGGVALRALGYFLVATIVALFLGLLAGNIVQPGAGFQGHPSDAQIAAATASVKTGSQESGFAAFLQNELFPTSFLQPFVDNQVLQVLVLAILTACSITFLSAGMRRQAVAAIDGIAKVVFGIIKIVMWTAPLAALSGMPYTVAAFSNLAGGMTSDLMVRRLGVKWGRRSLGIIGLGSACLFTIAVMFTRDHVMTIVLLTLVYAGITFQQSGVFAVCLDIGRNHAGSVIGLMNMSAQVGGFISSLAFGYIVDASGSYDAPFVPMAMLLGVGAILWLRIDASTPINVPEPEAGVSQL